MALLKSSPQDFIKEAFAPMFGVMHTPCVDDICKKNNLSFIQLVKPFAKSTVESSMKDTSSGFTIPVKNLKISFCDINSKPPPLTVARSYFNASISSNVTDKTTKVTVGEDTMDIPLISPWFEAWRDTFFQVQYPSEHEFTKHFVGCLIVVSSLDPSPLEKLEELLENLQGHLTSAPNKLPKWFFGSSSMILTAFLYLHDSSVSNLDTSIFDAMKVTYGVNKCFLLSINSQIPGDRVPQIPDPWSQNISSFVEYKDDDNNLIAQDQTQGIDALEEAVGKSSPSTPIIVHPLSPLSDGNLVTMPDYGFSEKNIIPDHGKLISPEDINRIKQFMNEFSIKALIPHFEQQIHHLSDQISNKKGVSRSLFSATKRWFVSNKPGTPGNHISPTAIAYSSDSHELQLRKLGDLCFMVGHYSLAFNAYHSAKRDFGADGAWLHYAGALEMAALSAYMSNSESLSRKSIEYAEESILTYQNSCRMNQFATRATLLSVECLKARGLYNDAAKQLIRMSGEDSDLRSAVLLEQAAYCFLYSSKPVQHRKYAFHMVLAGHRFSKAFHRNHAMRCYHQAFQVYGNKSWSVAEDHILYTIGKHASQLKLSSIAFEALSSLVTRSSRQSSQQQELYFRDYLLSIQQMYQKSDDEVILSLPVINSNLIQVVLNMPSLIIDDSKVPACDFTFSTSCVQKLSEQSMWHTMEEKIVNHASGSVGAFMIFKPTRDLLSNMTDNSSSAVGYTGEDIGVCVCLKNPLNVQIILRDLVLLWTIIPVSTGVCEDSSQRSDAALSKTVKEIVLPPDSTRYVMLTIIPNHVGELHITGLSYTLYDPVSDLLVYGLQRFVMLQKKVDRRLQISIMENAPRLEVCFSDLKKELISGEIYPFKIHLKNTGSVAISKIGFTTSSNFRIFKKSNEVKICDKIFYIDLTSPLSINNEITISMYMQPLTEGTKILDLLFYYESGLKNFKPSYRLVKHSWSAIAYSNIEINASIASVNTFREITTAGSERIIRFHLTSNLFNFVNIQNLQIHSASLNDEIWKICCFYGPKDMKINEGKDIYLMAKVIPSNIAGKECYKTKYFIQEDDTVFEYINNFGSKPITKNMENNIHFIFSWSVDLVSIDEGVRKAYGQDFVSVLCDSRSKKISLPSEVKSLASYPISSQKAIINSSLKDLIIRIKVFKTSYKNCEINKRVHTVLSIAAEIFNESVETIKVVIGFIPLPKISSRETLEDNMSDKFTWIERTGYNGYLIKREKVVITTAARISSPGAYDLASRVHVEAYDKRENPIKINKENCVIVVK